MGMPTDGALMGSNESPRRSAGQTGLLLVLHVYLAVHLGLVRLFGWLRKSRKRAAADRPVEVLLTGTFYSDNWVLAHIRPIAMSPATSTVRVVTTYEFAATDGVCAVVPSPRLRRVCGDVGARLLTFCYEAVRSRPDFVGGFHLLFNGLVASLVGRATGAQVLYFCVGGPAEVQGGGLRSENRLFEKIGTPSKGLEANLLAALEHFDHIVTMGVSARQYFRDHSVSTPISVVSGGIDLPAFTPAAERTEFDVIFIGRLAPIKRVDLFVDMVAMLREENDGIRAAIVGDGAERGAIEEQIRAQNLGSNIELAGFQPNPLEWLRRSRVFLLTSDSEGLSLALMEAMAAGLPAVVSDVGDLDNLVVDGENGFLVKERSPDAFARKVSKLLNQPSLLTSASSKARLSAEEFSVEKCSTLWKSILWQAAER